MKTLILSAAKTGHVNQCLAVCEGLGWKSDEVVRIPSPGRMGSPFERGKLELLRAAATWRARPRSRSASSLRVVSSGIAAERLVADYRALYGDDLFAIFSGRPRWPTPIFDIALAPLHALTNEERRSGFASPAARRTILRRGVPVRAAPQTEGKRRGALAMIGGANKAYEIDPLPIARQVEQMLLRDGARPFVLAFSRRTPRATESSLRRALGPENVRFINRSDREGFERALGEAAEYVVTPDSLTMICEACDTGLPVRVFDLACFDPASTTAVCVNDLIDGGDVAFAPDGVPQPQMPGRFRPPAATAEIYRAWDGTRGRAG